MSRPVVLLSRLTVFVVLSALPLVHAKALGGCGSSFLPVDANDFTQKFLDRHQLALSFLSEYGDCNNFMRGTEPVENNNASKAVIYQTSLFADYGLTDALKMTFSVPLIYKKRIENNAEGVAKGIGDSAVFVRYAVATMQSSVGPKFLIGIGLKFPSGAIDAPAGSEQKLPPAFQVGTGTYDLIPTVSYKQRWRSYNFYSSTHYRLPLQDNAQGYRFGREFRFALGMNYPVRLKNVAAALVFSFDYLNSEHDRDRANLLDRRFKQANKVLNTGGNFINFNTGFQIQFTEHAAAHVSMSFPLHDNWHASAGIGQLAPDYTMQLGWMWSM